MKTIKWILFLLILGGAGYLVWHFLTPYSKTEPLNAIPADAVFIAETNNLFEAWDKITNNKAWTKLKDQPLFSRIGKGVAMLDTIVNSNRQLSEFVGHRKVYVSMHMITSNKYDFAYIIDLRRISKILKLKDLVGSFSTSNLNIIKIEIPGGDIFKIEMKQSGQVFYCYFNNNLFVGSFSKSIVENSLKNSVNPTFGNDPYFAEIVEKTSSSGIFRLYVNYQRLNPYLKSMLVKLDENTKSLTSSFRYSGLTFDIERDGSIACNGFSSINDSVHSSLRAVINSGMGTSSIEYVLPSNVSSSVSFCFNKFTEYFDNMQESLKQTPYSYNNYQKEIETVEKFLDIDVRENFLDWIGEEVTLAQLAPMGLGKNNEFAVFLKTTNPETAEENLSLIEKKIKNRTPVKIEDVDYKGFAIHYLSVKGFFKMLLGKYFQKLETPYYTTIGEYVVFSNHPQVLKTIIDAQSENLFLAKVKSFSDFYSPFERKSNAMIIVNTANFIESMKYDLKPQTIKQLEENRSNLSAYPFLGFQLSKEGELFKTRFYAFYNEPAVNSETLETEEELYSSNEDSVKILIDNWLLIADSYLVVDLKKDKFIENYASGQVKVEFEVKDGFRHGEYREYHENGELKIKGEYTDDKKSGVWKFYSTKGKLIQKKEYKNGELQN